MNSGIAEFFEQSELLKKIAAGYPFVYEQATRAFFYYKSTFEERARLIEENMQFLSARFNEDFLLKLYGDKKIELWKMPLDETLGEMRLVMCAESGQRKEGLAAIMLTLPDETPIYQILFWIARSHDGKWAMFIGAMQGPNVDDAKELVKRITKKCLYSLSLLDSATFIYFQGGKISPNSCHLKNSSIKP